MSELLVSKKFIPIYFIVGLLAITLFRSLEFSWLEVFMSTFLVFFVGVISFMRNFIFNSETRYNK